MCVHNPQSANMTCLVMSLQNHINVPFEIRDGEKKTTLEWIILCVL